MKFFTLIFLFGLSANATMSGTVVSDPNGNLVDPRARTWNLLNSTDSVNAVQSGTWNITNISGTISLPTGAATSANQSTEITALQLIDNPVGSVSAGTAGTSSYLTGGVFSSTPPSLTNGQQVATQVDAAGNLKISSKTALTANSPTVASVGTSSAQAVASNTSRKGLVLQNNSVNTIYIGIGATAVIGSGITLYPGGIWYMDEYSLVTGAINAIASGAASSMAIQEFQ